MKRIALFFALLTFTTLSHATERNCTSQVNVMISAFEQQLPYSDKAKSVLEDAQSYRDSHSDCETFSYLMAKIIK